MIVCRIVSFKIGNRTIKAAEMKRAYIENIAEKARACDNIDRVILFGSATGENCTKESDIDIAVFGKVPENRMLKSKAYKDFVRSLFRYDYSQDYDILYFDTTRNTTGVSVLGDIDNGEILYEKA